MLRRVPPYEACGGATGFSPWGSTFSFFFQEEPHGTSPPSNYIKNKDLTLSPFTTVDLNMGGEIAGSLFEEWITAKSDDTHRASAAETKFPSYKLLSCGLF